MWHCVVTILGDICTIPTDEFDPKSDILSLGCVYLCHCLLDYNSYPTVYTFFDEVNYHDIVL